MKIRFKEIVHHDWDEIDLDGTRKVNKYFDREAYDEEMKPVTLKNLEIGLNRVGQLVMSFDSKNHKYFKIRSQSMCSMSWDDNPIEVEEGSNTPEEYEFGSRSFGIESCERIVPKDQDWETWLWCVEVVLTPETQEEETLLGDCIDSLPTKWAYQILFLDLDDYFAEKVTDKESGEPDSIQFENTVYQLSTE